MIKEAIDKILTLAPPTVEEYNGALYSNRELHRIHEETRANGFEVSSLTGIVDYLTQVSEDMRPRKYMVCVNSHQSVSVMSTLDADRKRETLILGRADLPHITFGKYLDNESFTIMLQALFTDDPETDKAALLRFAGTVQNGSVSEYSDDGITQAATVKKGITTLSKEIVPSPCRLRPYRTFREIEQPVSSFIFRMKNVEDTGIQCALFEADGGAWENAAMASIKAYLSEALSGLPNVVVIA